MKIENECDADDTLCVINLYINLFSIFINPRKYPYNSYLLLKYVTNIVFYLLL